MVNRVAILGSRCLPQSFASQVGYVVACLQRAGVRSWSSCCGRGACQYAREAFAKQSLSAVAIFAASAFPASSFVGSLCLRSVACVRGCQVGGAVVVFLASSASVGSCKEMRLAASLGIPVFAFACGFPPELLPLVGVGSWQRVPSGALAGAWQWCAVHGQPALFV